MNAPLSSEKKRQSKMDETKLDIVMAMYNRMDVISLRTIGRAVGILDANYNLKRAKPDTLITFHAMPEVKPEVMNIDDLFRLSGITEKDLKIAKKYKVLLDDTLYKYLTGEIKLNDIFPEEKEEEAI